jgi:pyruvate/2-oxoglutarate/acetoin dehydrogenase E1 component
MTRDTITFADAIESAVAHMMEQDERVFIMGEDVQLLRVNFFGRFGKERVRNTPISESAFLMAGVTAAMAGLRPIVEIMLIDFIGVCMDALLNHASKTKAFSGGTWDVPMVVRAACGGGYGDGGQHEQSLWGWLAHIPGLSVVVPSNPADAYGLMISAIESNSTVIFLEHKLLADYWLDYLGSGGRTNVDYDVPEAGIIGPVPEAGKPVVIGTASLLKEGGDITITSLGVSVHRALEAAEFLEEKGISAEVIDLRSVSPLDVRTIEKSVKKTKRLLVVDEDYEQFGLSGEIAASLLERDLSFTYKRLCTRETIPYSRELEDSVLPGVDSIYNAVINLVR